MVAIKNYLCGRRVLLQYERLCQNKTNQCQLGLTSFGTGFTYASGGRQIRSTGKAPADEGFCGSAWHPARPAVLG